MIIFPSAIAWPASEIKGEREGEREVAGYLGLARGVGSASTFPLI